MSRQFLIYTTEEGGLFKFGYPDRFDVAVETGRLDITPADRDPAYRDLDRSYVEPVYMALVGVEKDYDFKLRRSREQAERS